MIILMQEKKENDASNCMEKIENVIRKMMQVCKDTWNLMLAQQNHGKLETLQDSNIR